ncbi:hypothetical protein OAK64_02445 [Deltaproteobacteria bacterium]|nr:hypothetical protein [Deltaproteobacteria bacterium]
MRKKRILRFAVLSLLVFSVSCTKKDDNEEVSTTTNYIAATTTCSSSTTAPTVSESDVMSPPSGVQNQLVGHYTPTKYIKVADHNIHVFGTENVSNWMMVHTHEMARNIVSSLLSSVDQQKFYDHHIFVITDNDSTIGTTQGQRNTGSSKYTVMNQVLVCATAVDTIRPNDAAVYRAWDTPIHEFGHSIHEVLDILDTFIALEDANNTNYNENLKNEYFAWAIENWFDANLDGSCGSSTTQGFESGYLATKFSTSNIWKASCLGRP